MATANERVPVLMTTDEKVFIKTRAKEEGVPHQNIRAKPQKIIKALPMTMTCLE